MTDKQGRTASVTDAFERALGEIRTRVCASISTATRFSIAVGYSGGLDSSVLLHLVHQYAVARNIDVFAFHIHHGLSANADDWLAHCERQCARLGIVFGSRRADLGGRHESGTEEAARIGRYAALGELCRIHQIPVLLTAHHQDDQAETVLLQLLRGSGVAGLSGMDIANTAADLLGDPHLIIGRPLLALSRAALQSFADEANIAHIDDESNADTRYARNAVRHEVMPILAKRFPGCQERFARSAKHAQSAQRLLEELAAQDLQGCIDGACLDIGQLKRLNLDRIDNLLRHWLGLRGVRMPSTSWLIEMRTQLLEAKADAQIHVAHPDCDIRRYRDRLFLTPKSSIDPSSVPPSAFRWNGEAQLPFLSYGGILHFETASQGIDAEWLRRQDLSLRFRYGGERLKLASNRSTRSLKHHYQALNVPAWERERLPLVTLDDHVLFAAGIGMDCHHFSTSTGSCICFRWQPDHEE
ncbi:MAG TPA: tRNA lysidine(34) synthetase TilS [Paucimonas sp.]|nr:tRNA lysidine(34) synthetase TilS [Paucimonas sp.]